MNRIMCWLFEHHFEVVEYTVKIMDKGGYVILHRRECLKCNLVDGDYLATILGGNDV